MGFEAVGFTYASPVLLQMSLTCPSLCCIRLVLRLFRSSISDCSASISRRASNTEKHRNVRLVFISGAPSAPPPAFKLQ